MNDLVRYYVNIIQICDFIYSAVDTLADRPLGLSSEEIERITECRDRLSRIACDLFPVGCGGVVVNSNNK